MPDEAFGPLSSWPGVSGSLGPSSVFPHVRSPGGSVTSPTNSSTSKRPDAITRVVTPPSPGTLAVIHTPKSQGSSGGFNSPPTSPPTAVDSRLATPVTSPTTLPVGRPPTSASRVVSPSGITVSRGGGGKGSADAATRKTAEALITRLRTESEGAQPSKQRIRPGHWKLGNKIGKGSYGQVRATSGWGG